MFDRWAEEFDRTYRHPSCDEGTHDDCPHLLPGFGFDPRVLRLRAGANLCTCDCHAACPVTSQWQDVTVRLWRESCVCPGAEAERRSHDEHGAPPDLGERLAQQQAKSAARKAAFNAVQAEADGLTREELKARYIAELRSRNLDVPPPPILEPALDALTGNYLPAYTTVAHLMGTAAGNIWSIFN